MKKDLIYLGCFFLFITIGITYFYSFPTSPMGTMQKKVVPVFIVIGCLYSFILLYWGSQKAVDIKRKDYNI
jgi:hypothetical protein